MNDLISRQAAIDAVRQHKANVLGERKWDEGIAYGYEAAHEHICEVLAVLPSAQSEPRWIPVEDEPPKEKKRYWICTDTGYQCECRWTNNIYGMRESDNWGWSIFDIPQYSKVVAYMSLPKPYERR